MSISWSCHDLDFSNFSGGARHLAIKRLAAGTMSFHGDIKKAT
jgi:hypothetical protein